MADEATGDLHLSDAELTAYLGHELAGQALEEAELHLARCGECRAAVVEATAILRPARRARLPVFASIAAAAAAVLFFTVWPQAGPSPVPPASHRDAPAASVAPAAIAPAGPSDEVREFVWSRAAGAERYRLTLFDAEGAVLWKVATTDTLLRLPAFVPLYPGRQYLWKVESRSGWDTWESSALTPFEIGGQDTSRSDRTSIE